MTNKNLILCPLKHAPWSYVTDRPISLFDLMGQRLGFKTQYGDTCPELPANTDTVLVYAAPEHSAKVPDLLMGAAHTPKNALLVMMMDDVHDYYARDKDRFKTNMHKMMARADLILAPSDSLFRQYWPEYIDKFHFFPNWFGPQARYTDLEYNENPEMRCVLMGNQHVKYYPIRHNLDRQSGNLMDIMHRVRHPHYQNDIPNSQHLPVRDNYAKILNTFFCGLATAGSMKYVVAKYMEIPAVGSLLLGQRTADLDKCGFLSGDHYVEIDGQSVVKVMRDVLSRPEDFEQIRMAGMEFVRENHGVENRFEEIEGLLEKARAHKSRLQAAAKVPKSTPKDKPKTKKRAAKPKEKKEDETL